MATYTSQPAEAAATDTFIAQSTATTNYATNAELNVGEVNDDVLLYRTLIKFDLSTIPAFARIVSASLTLVVSTDKSSNARDFKVYRVLRDWVEAEVTWNVWKTGSNWSTAGCGSDGNDADLTNVWATASMTATETTDEAKEFTFSATGIAELQKMIDGTSSNYGWLIKADTESNDGYRFHSSSSATAAYYPLLTIEYGAGQSMVWTSD